MEVYLVESVFDDGTIGSEIMWRVPGSNIMIENHWIKPDELEAVEYTDKFFNSKDILLTLLGGL